MSGKTMNKAEDEEAVKKVAKTTQDVTEENLAGVQESYRQALGFAQENQDAISEVVGDMQTVAATVASKMMAFGVENTNTMMQASREMLACRTWPEVVRLHSEFVKELTSRQFEQSRELFGLYSDMFQRNWREARGLQKSAARRVTGTR